MGKKQVFCCKANPFKPIPDVGSRDFAQNVKESLILALLDKNYITKWECEELIKTNHTWHQRESEEFHKEDTVRQRERDKFYNYNTVSQRNSERLYKEYNTSHGNSENIHKITKEQEENPG